MLHVAHNFTQILNSSSTERVEINGNVVEKQADEGGV